MPLIAADVLPIPTSIRSAYTPIFGWYVDEGTQPVDIEFDGVRLTVAQDDRNDLHKVHPGKTCRGFYSILEINDFDRRVVGPRTIAVSVGGQSLLQRAVVVDAEALASATRSRLARAENRAFVLSRLICSGCGRSLAGNAAPARCLGCGVSFAAGTRAVSAVEAGSYAVPTAINTSFCGYDHSEHSLIAQVAAAGGRILDFGAGLRPETNPTVISLEIADMPSTDIVSLADRIPFADDTFDAAMSLHVLEHVPRPWVTAKELLRVVKPGGTIVSTVPYVCPVHGFPYHYYSMTPQGLRDLFSGAEVVSHVMKADAHPINGIRQLLGTYAGSLSTPLRDAFESLTLREILTPDLSTILTQPWAEGLSEAARWELPAHSTLTVKKPSPPVV